MKITPRTLFFLLLVASLLSACGMPEPDSTTGYWVPPKAPPAQAVELALLSATGIPALDPPAATPASQTQSDLPSPTPMSPTATPTSGDTTLAPQATPDAPLRTATESQISLPTATPTWMPTGKPETPPPLPTFPTPTATPLVAVVNTSPILYYAQAADTLPVVAIRFGVEPGEITSSEPIPQTGFIKPGQLLIIPRRLTNTTSSQQLIPDSEVVFAPSAVDFDASVFAASAGGYLSTFNEWHRSTGLKSGAEIVMRVAIENSINPRLLLAMMEYQSGWVLGQPTSQQKITYPMGKIDLATQGLYNQLVWSVNQLSIGYYAYREGRLTEIRFKDGTSVRLAPDMNAGTAALQYYFAQLYSGERWLKAIDPSTGFPALYEAMFGNPWARAQTVEPLFPPGVSQPPLILPFGRDRTWAYTGGPHGAWERDGAFAALDFAPGTVEGGCHDSNAWVVAVADGLVVRTGNGLVVLDLDGDGKEQTGWVIVYLHIATKDRIPLGEWLAVGQHLGHASCEGGFATGTHIHIARKFNGEWVPADGPLPFNLGGWIAHAGSAPYKGTLTRDGQTVTACVCSNAASFVTRTNEDP